MQFNKDEAFIFVSYAHCDKAKVMPYITELSNRSYNIWFDDGIHPGTEWNKEIFYHLDRCSLFLFFITETSLNSPYCNDEISFAKNRKPFINVVIDDVQLSDYFMYRFGEFQFVDIKNYQQNPKTVIRDMVDEIEKGILYLGYSQQYSKPTTNHQNNDADKHKQADNMESFIALLNDLYECSTELRTGVKNRDQALMNSSTALLQSNLQKLYYSGEKYSALKKEEGQYALQIVKQYNIYADYIRLLSANRNSVDSVQYAMKAEEAFSSFVALILKTLNYYS